MELCNAQKAADILRVSVGRIRQIAVIDKGSPAKAIEAGKLPGNKLNARAWMFQTRHVERFRDHWGYAPEE